MRICVSAVFLIVLIFSEAAFCGVTAMGDKRSQPITLFMCGDVMTGRGIDQILPRPGDPLIHEPYMKSAKGYVELAEQVNGPINQPVSCSYIWGDALEILKQTAPDVRIINLETSVTKSDDYWEGKAIHYRMHPDNISCIAAARIDVAVLANNHVMDWGHSGLKETIDTLKKADIKSTGAGRNLQEAQTPSVVTVEGKGRVLVFSYGSTTSGIPSEWAASANNPGVNLLSDLSDETVSHIKKKIEPVKQQGDIVVISIHWGSNWDYDIPREQIRFAHNLIDDAGVDIIHGHSSHHVKGIEIYKDRLIIYGAGDFLNDYEGIPGYENFRDDLGLMYIVSVDPSTGKTVHLRMTPTQIKNFKVNRASGTDSEWMRDTLNREGKKFGTRAELTEDNNLKLLWESGN